MKKLLIGTLLITSIAKAQLPPAAIPSSGAGNGGDYSSVQLEYVNTRINQLKKEYILFANSQSFYKEYGHLNISKEDYIDVVLNSNISFSSEVLIDKLGQVKDALNFSNGNIIFSDKEISDLVNSREFAVLFQHEHLNLLGVEIGSFHESIKMWNYIDMVRIAKLNMFKKKKDYTCKDLYEDKWLKKTRGDNSDALWMAASVAGGLGALVGANTGNEKNGNALGGAATGLLIGAGVPLAIKGIAYLSSVESKKMVQLINSAESYDFSGGHPGKQLKKLWNKIGRIYSLDQLSSYIVRANDDLSLCGDSHQIGLKEITRNLKDSVIIIN